MDLSIVIPFYNEEDSIRPLYNAVTESMTKLNYTYELILVDDGSKDNTLNKMIEIAKKDSRLKIVKLKKNYGQTTGLHAGFQNAIGKYIVTMDGDLQNDPSDIGRMMEKLGEGNDICLGWRDQRQDAQFTRLLPSKIANSLVRNVTGIPVKDNGCAIRSYKAETINKFPMYSEMHRLLPVINALTGASFTQIPVKHHARKFGSSKYGLSRIYKVILDLIALKTVFSSFNKPLFGFGTTAIVSGLLFLISTIITFLTWLFNPGYPLVVLLGTSALTGILTFTIIFLGIICHLIYKSGNLKIEKMYKLKTNKV
ncbi:MAG: glycosyltransferase family 2 protein [Ignavibacteriae bacterium]|nr:glycosyltransferase family 2 protein [Ignavibacteriota bacterium]MCB9207959.1 glycosyltransferase family 2 protein [Ignavibacteriales bacterium]MCB9258728.1 glycosyltransferase family 2 protein [Ignavibacteriales bacterium]